MTLQTGYYVCRRADTLRPHRVLADSGGRLWIFFQNRYQYLSCGFSDSGGADWSPATDLLADVSGPFSSCVDGRIIHLAARSRHPQDIHHLCWNGLNWSSRKVYSARDSTATTCFPLVEVCEGRLHVVFSARDYSLNTWSVVDARINAGADIYDGGFLLPGAGRIAGWDKEMGFLTDSLFWSGSLAADAGGVLHLAYRTFLINGYHLFYTFLAPGGASWEKPVRITGRDLCEGHPAICSIKGSIYLAYRSKEAKRSIKVLALSGSRWITCADISLGSGSEVLAEGFLPGDQGPLLYWADREACRLAPLEGHPHEVLIRPEGGKIQSFSASGDGRQLFAAWTQPADPKREIFFKKI